MIVETPRGLLIDVNANGLYPSEEGLPYSFETGAVVTVAVQHPMRAARQAVVVVESSRDGATWAAHYEFRRNVMRSQVRHFTVNEPVRFRVRVSAFVEPFQIRLENR